MEVGSATKAATWPALIVIGKVCSQLLITSEEKGSDLDVNGTILFDPNSLLLKVLKSHDPPSDL